MTRNKPRGPVGCSSPSAVRTREWLLLLSLFCASRIACYLIFPCCSEDAYITFRAARNWVLAGAPTFNPGEPSWPASSPLWSAWMALGLWAGSAPEWWARIGSLLSECLLVVGVGRILTRSGTICFTLLLGLFQPAVCISMSGIEMYAMISAFVWALLGNRFALALLTISRPEGILLALLASKAKWRNVIPILIGLVLWLDMALLVRVWLPQGVTAKVGTYGIHWFAGWTWIQHLFWPLGPDKERMSLGVIGLSSLFLCWRWRPKRPEVTFVLSGISLLFAYFALGTAYFSWYTALPICAVALLVANAVSRWRLAYAIVTLIALASWSSPYMARRDQIHYANFALLASVIPDEGTAALDAVGVIGWEKPNLRLVDLVGLISPSSMNDRLRGDGWMGRILQRERPVAVVLYQSEIETNLPLFGAGKLFDGKSRFAEYEPLARTLTSNPAIVLVRSKR